MTDDIYREPEGEYPARWAYKEPTMSDEIHEIGESRKVTDELGVNGEIRGIVGTVSGKVGITFDLPGSTPSVLTVFVSQKDIRTSIVAFQRMLDAMKSARSTN